MKAELVYKKTRPRSSRNTHKLHFFQLTSNKIFQTLGAAKETAKWRYRPAAVEMFQYTSIFRFRSCGLREVRYPEIASYQIF